MVPPSSDCVCELPATNPDVWIRLAQLSGGKSPFPQLRELHWAIQGTSGTELLSIVSLSLGRLTICYGGCSVESQGWVLGQEMLFRNLFSVASDLTHLAFYETHESLLSRCLSDIPVLSKLRVVFLDQDKPAGLDVFRNLSSVESLEELSIGVGSMGRVDFCGFPALKTLDITFLSGPPHRVFEGFSSPHLRRLRVWNEDFSDVTDVDELFNTSTALAKSFPAMADLGLTLSLCDPDGGNASGSLGAALAPLLPLPVTNFSLRSQAPLVSPGLNDGFFTAIAQSWPRLLELSIVIPRASDDDAQLSSTTTQSLIALARGCPQLRTLSLPTMKSPMPGEIEGCPVMQHPLRTLAVSWLAVGWPVVEVDEEEPELACALLLDKLFPWLYTGSVLCGVSVTDPWKRVLSGVRLLQLGRSNRAV